jgi:ferredoxin-NADP reductase
VKLPYGEFVIDRSRDAVLFAGGTGVTAFTAYLQSLEAGWAPRVLLFYGARTPDLFIYRPMIEDRARAVPSLVCRFVAEAADGVLNVDAVWPAIAALEDPVCYVSGPPAMLVALTAQLLDRGISEAAVRTDAWE